MICPGLALFSQHLARQFAETTPHPVANHGVADLLGNGNPQPFRRIVILPVANEQNKTGSCISLPPVGGQKVCPLFDDAVTAHIAVR